MKSLSAPQRNAGSVDSRRKQSFARELPPTAGMPLLARDFVYGLSALPALKTRHAQIWTDPAGLSFEQLLCRYLEVPELHLYPSATFCLNLAFETIKEISGRKKLILPAYTCPLVAIAAELAGMEILICDTVKDGFDFDPGSLDLLADESVAAVVPTAIAGLPADIGFLKELKAKYGFLIVEDAAQALGARRDGLPLGADADLVVYSLAVGKGLSLYDGGIIAGSNTNLLAEIQARAARKIKQSGKAYLSLLRQLQLLGLALFYRPGALKWIYGNQLRKHLSRNELELAVGDYFELEIPAYSFDSFRKRVAASALMRLPDFVSANRRRGLERAALIETNCSTLKVLSEKQGQEGSWPFLMLLASSNKERDQIMSELWTSGLGVTRLFINSLAGYKYLEKFLPAATTPNADSFAARSFSVSNSEFMTDAEFARVLSLLSY